MTSSNPTACCDSLSVFIFASSLLLLSGRSGADDSIELGQDGLRQRRHHVFGQDPLGLPAQASVGAQSTFYH